MSFVHPGWLLLALILPLLLLGAILTHRGRNKAWRRMVAPRLRKQLVKEGSTTRRWISLALGLIGCALIIIVIARPHHGETATTEQIRTRNILLAVDTSRSMLVRDVSPDRISNAKAMALELISAFPDDRIGIIAFAGAPVLMAPLTIDHSAVHETISQLDTNVIPSGGSDLASAVALANKTFKKSGHKSNALIIISDGEDHSQQIQLAGSEIRDAGIVVCTIGVGKTEGGIIPDRRNLDGKFRDLSGNTVHSRLNPDALDQLARAGRGSYVPATSGADNAIRQALTFLESDQQAGRKVRIPNESYQWFLLPAILLLGLSLVVRSNLFTPRLASPAAAAIITITLLTSNVNLQAATDIDQAAAAYDNHDYEAALDFFGKALLEANGEDRRAIQFSQGSSAYRLEQWDIATRHFSRALLTDHTKLQEQSHYNLGNALFRSGWATLNPPGSSEPAKTANPFLEQMRRHLSKKKTDQPDSSQPELTSADIQRIMTNWQDAISHYQEAVKLNSDNKNAEDNRREVEKLLKQLQDAVTQAEKESKKDNGEQPKQDEGEKSDDKKDGQGDDNNPKQDPDNKGQDDRKNKPDSSDQKNDDSNQHPEEGPDDNQPMQRREGESKEAFAARILKEQSDAETRPVNRRNIRLRRPAKDW